ncbi:MAG: twin-arginine translocase TatA/TatE family subunit [Chloroflexi bacterium]|nr:twin-arginine translocase TatA/TatE family subunit [Chloroflexota bacterium]
MGVGIFEPWHLVLILVIILMLFGPGKLPSVGRGIGDAFRELKKATSDEPPEDPTSDAKTTTTAQATTAAPTASTVTTCKSCGATVAPQQKFCATCGAAVPEPGAVSSPR